MSETTGMRPEHVAPPRPTTLARAIGPARRVFGSAAIAVITATAVVLPLQAPADAAPTTAAVGNLSSNLSSVSGAKAGLSTSAAHKTSYKGGLSRATYERRLQTWANRVRHRHGIRRIAVRPCHDGYAERWAGYLARHNQFRHQDLGKYMTRCKLSKAGEILALGSVSPHKMIQMWLHSPDHRRILLDRSFGLSGIAARRDGDGDWIGCIDFGRR